MTTPRFSLLYHAIPWGLALAWPCTFALAADAPEEIVVVGTTPTGSLGQDLRKLPFNAQSVSGVQLADSLSLDLTEHLNARLASVSLNTAQNNPLQQDLQFRGFTASPLLGLPQGVAVYQDGVRINEPLGDAVNWDTIPDSAIAGMTLLSGANPVFGLNALGGVINLRMKNGFNFAATEAELQAGAWGRLTGSLESGANNGILGYYVNISHFQEDGWRDLSRSDNLNLYGSLSWRDGTRSALDLVLQNGASDLRGNGPAPAGLLALDREAVFTAPDITRNRMNLLSLNGSHQASEGLLLSATVYRRDNNTSSFNGDASELGVCQFAGGQRALLDDASEAAELLEEALDLDLDSLCAGGSLAGLPELAGLIEARAIQRGLDPQDFELEDISDTLSGSGEISDEAINNLSRRYQASEGFEGQATFTSDLAGRPNRLVVGYSHFRGTSRFRSVSELSRLDPQSRSTYGLGVGTFLDHAATSIGTLNNTWGVFLTDTVDVTETLSLTVSGRFNSSELRLRDRSGERPELNGDHDFSRLNPAIGLAWQMTPAVNAYLSYSESNRVPTPIELSCNEAIFEAAQARVEAQGDDPDEVDFECRLPNAFLADPPLDDVVTHNVEAGLRGNLLGLDYSVGLFRARNQDDIIFQTTGRATGLFANVDQTRRAGFETSFSGSAGALDWFAVYSRVDATFEDEFLVLSPNHEFADRQGNIVVDAGDRIPGIPRHQAKLGASYRFGERWSVGGELLYNSAQYLRGDESNQLDQVDGFAVANLRVHYDPGERLRLFLRVTNLFDTEYESFGLLGEDPSGVIDFLQDDAPVFLGAGSPRGIWLGARLRL